MPATAKKLWAVVALSVVLAGCASAPPSKLSSEPMGFESALRSLTENLLAQLKTNQPMLESFDELTLVVEPMIDANTAEVTMASLRIEEIISDEIRKHFPKVKLLPFNQQFVETSMYILTGMIKLMPKNGVKGSEVYRIISSIINLKTYRVMASAEARVADPKLDMTPVSVYQDTPMYTKDKRADSLRKTVEAAPGQMADKVYMDGLTTATLLVEGDRMYDAKTYGKALGFYKEASLRADGQTMRIYAAIYQAYRKLNRMEDAEVAFGALIALGYTANNINIKLMFRPGKVQFIEDPDLRAQYVIWLRQLGKLFSKVKSCLNIIGHTSHTGEESYNQLLSLQRAQYVQNLLHSEFPNILKRSTAIGRGWTENIVGIGSDDQRDAIDRRVEFKITPCG